MARPQFTTQESNYGFAFLKNHWLMILIFRKYFRWLEVRSPLYHAIQQQTDFSNFSLEFQDMYNKQKTASTVHNS